MLTLAIWIMVYANHPGRGYVYKDPPAVVKQYADREACEADPFYQAMAKDRHCIEVSKVPSCYNSGSVCKIDPVDNADQTIVKQLVPYPN